MASDKRRPNLCPKCGAPLKFDKTCVMGELRCAQIRASNLRSLAAKVDAEQQTRTSSSAPEIEERTQPSAPESVDFCKRCGLHRPRSTARCPNCGASHTPPGIRNGTVESTPLSTSCGHIAPQPGTMSASHTCQDGDDPVVTWVVPGNLESDDSSASVEQNDAVPDSTP